MAKKSVKSKTFRQILNTGLKVLHSPAELPYLQLPFTDLMEAI